MINNFLKIIHNRYSKLFKFIFFLRYLFLIFSISMALFLIIPKFFNYEKKLENIKNYLLKYKDDYYKPLIHNKEYNTLLHYSVKYNYKYLLEFLVKFKNDINIKKNFYIIVSNATRKRLNIIKKIAYLKNEILIEKPLTDDPNDYFKYKLNAIEN